MREFFLNIIQLNLTECIILSLMFIITTIVVIFHARYYIRIKNRPQYKHLPPNPISVILAVGNRKRFTESNLPYFLSQNHPEYEVIVVYDTDDNDMSLMLESMAVSNPHLRIFPFDYMLNAHNNNKFAESIGIRIAKYDNIILSDISTRPNTENWAKSMSKFFSANAYAENEIGYCKIAHKRGFANIWIRYNHFQNAIEHCYYALIGKEFSGDERNFAFKREKFLNLSGMAGYYNTDFGNESIYINKSAYGYRFYSLNGFTNTGVNLDEDSFVIAHESTPLRTWYRSKISQQKFLQEIKSSIKQNIYIRRYLVFGYWLLVTMMVVFFFENFGIMQNTGYFGLFVCFWIIVLKITIDTLLLGRVMRFFHEKISPFSIILCEIFGIFAYSIARIRSWRTK
jgi:hypothetical protein